MGALSTNEVLIGIPWPSLYVPATPPVDGRLVLLLVSCEASSSLFGGILFGGRKI
ncbi:hypothetical protein DsansV1_C04g0047661 [Dioscorea sansibarensis]